MKIDMKLYSLVFALILMVACSQQLSGQLPCGGIGIPDDNQEYMSCNRLIAEMFAPKLVQFVDDCEEESEDGASDRITKVNWDNDWVATNNWQSVEEYTENNTGWDNSPYGYYAVYWTPDEWVIVYSYFYSRDYATNGAGCGEDEHENDLQRVLVVVKRPVTGLENPEDLLLGFMTGPDDKERCISTDINDSDYNVEITTTPPGGGLGDVALGAHPIIYSSAGSHHFHTTEQRGFEDATNNNPLTLHCRPIPVSKINYLPAYHTSNISGYVPIEHDQNNDLCLLHCTKVYTVGQINNCSSHDEYYGLIDVMHGGGGGEGLWAERNNNELFSDPPTSGQHFLADDGGGTNGQGIIEDAFAAAPWKGSMGASPLTVAAEQLSPFNCDCNNNSNCQDYEITGCTYLYNPYICESYGIETPDYFDYQNAWVENPHWVDNPLNANGDLIAVFTFSAFGGYTGTPESIIWDYDVPPGKTVNCLLGCSPSGNRLMLEFVNTSEEEIVSNPDGYSISVSAEFLECGKIEITKSLSEVIDGFIITDGNCTKMIYQVPDDHHIDGSQYEWDFPGYNNLKATSMDGRRVEFNTQSVRQQTSPTTNPQDEMNYTLTVSNASFPIDVEVTGKQEIPDCNFNGGLGLRIYPNPAQGNINLSFVNLAPHEEVVIHVFNHQFNKVASHTYTLGQPSIDVSKLENGLYFLCATTKDGKMLTEKFCIDRH